MADGSFRRPKISDRCVFVTGSSRSGTELMRTILNSSQEIYIAPETHYFDDLRARLPGRRLEKPLESDWHDAIHYFERLQQSAYGLSGAESRGSDPLLREYLGRVAQTSAYGLDELFATHCANVGRLNGKNVSEISVWGEKTPRHIFRGEQILSTFPAAKIVFMLRDPRAVVASYRDWENNWINRSEASLALKHALDAETRRVRRSYSLTMASLMWRSAVATAMRLQRTVGPNRIHIVRFESLLIDPDTSLEKLSFFLNLKNPLSPKLVRRVNSSYADSTGLHGFDKRALDQWQTKLADTEMSYIEWITGDLMDRHGYQRKGRAHSVPFALRELAHAIMGLTQTFALNRGRMGSPVGSAYRRIKGLLGF